MFPLDLSYLRPNLGDDNRLYYRYLAYVNKVKAIETADLILYHRMNEESGGVAFDESAQGNNGAYTGVTLGQAGKIGGDTCPLFDGANDYNDIYTAGLRDDFDGAEGTLAIWVKVSGVGVWTDGAQRVIAVLRAGFDDRIHLEKITTSNRLTWTYRAGGTSEAVTKSGLSETDFLHMALTWSKTSDEVIAYYNGIQEGATQTGLGIWAGNIATGWCQIGAQRNTPAQVFDGYLDQALIWKKALTPAQILEVATV